MKINILKILLTILIIFQSISFADITKVDYISIGYANQKVDNKLFDKGKSLVLNAGKNNVYKNLGLELESTLQLNKPEATYNALTSDLKFWTMGMYGTYLWKIDNITIKPRVGIVYESIKSSFNTDNKKPLKNINKNKLGISAGIGISYKITKKSNIYTSYTKFEDDIDHLTFGAEFKF